MDKLKRCMSGLLVFSMCMGSVSFFTPFSLNAMAAENLQEGEEGDNSYIQTILTDETRIEEGSSGIFKPEVSVSGDIKRLQFESSDTSVLEIEEDSGVYKALHYGIATISVTGYGVASDDDFWDDNFPDDSSWEDNPSEDNDSSREDNDFNYDTDWFDNDSDIAGGNYTDWTDDNLDEIEESNTDQTGDNADEYGWDYREWIEDNSNDDKWYDVGQGSDEEIWYDVGQDSTDDNSQYTDDWYDDGWYDDWYNDYFNDNDKDDESRHSKLKTLESDGGSAYEETELFNETYIVYVTPNMSNVTFDKSSLSIYIAKGYYNTAGAEIKINSGYIFNQEDELTEFSYSSSNEDMYVFCELVNNVITIGASNSGSTTVNININGKIFNIKLKVIEVSLSKTSLLLTKGKSAQLKVKGTKIKTVWKSSKSKVASVNGKGKIKAKKYGNTIISAKVGDLKIGCVVSVTSSKKKKVVLKALKIGRGIYSQEKRMQKGYYDCSSLVWRAYSPQGYYFGDKSYAPVAASVAQYLSKNHKIVKGGLSAKNLQGLKLQAGDLFFETGADNGRFKGVYHVEMFAGYEFGGFDSSGKAYVYSKWAARPTGYYGYAKGLVGRP